MLSSPEYQLLASTTDPTITQAYISIFWITLVALLSPLLSALLRKKIPDVVILLLLGALIGPHAWGLADTSNGITLIKELGLGILFLIAGYEVNTNALRSRQGGFAAGTWLVCFGLGIVAGGIITGWSKDFATVAVLAIAMSSTALGTILPMVRNNGKTGTRLGDAILVHGAIGEVMPICAMALLLSSHSTGMSVVFLIGFMAIALITAVIPHRAFEHVPGLRRVMASGASATTQTMLRLALVLLSTLMMIAAVFDLDVVLGAFAAGIILRSLTPQGTFEPFSKRLDVLGFSFLIPLFFITSGMGIKLSVAASHPWLLLGVVFALLTIRGLPVVLCEKLFTTHSGLRNTNEQIQLGLYSAAGLPILVAVTEIAVKSKLLSEDNASLLVAAGALTILIFPLQAVAIDRIFDKTVPAEAEKPKKEKIQEKKAVRTKTAKLNTNTGVMPTVAPKDSGPDAGRG